MSGHKSAFGSIFRNVSFLTVGRIVNALCSFVYTAFAVRALGLADFGLLILIHSLATTGSMLSRMQSWQTLIRYGSQAFSDGQADLLRRVTSFCVRLDFISAGCAVVFSLVATQIYAFTAHWSLHDRLMADLYVCVAPFMYTGWCNGVLRMAGKFHLVPVSDTCTAVVRTLGVLLGFFLGFKLAYFFVCLGCHHHTGLRSVHLLCPVRSPYQIWIPIFPFVSWLGMVSARHVAVYALNQH
ncbi:membrane protein [Gluconobacter frateurii NBRC 103465]|nr:membrane protein [Gluconobacter frateurii NBRC 103465]